MRTAEIPRRSVPTAGASRGHFCRHIRFSVRLFRRDNRSSRREIEKERTLSEEGRVGIGGFVPRAFARLWEYLILRAETVPELSTSFLAMTLRNKLCACVSERLLILQLISSQIYNRGQASFIVFLWF